MKTITLTIVCNLIMIFTTAQEKKTYYNNGQIKEVFKGSKDKKKLVLKKFLKSGKLFSVYTYINGEIEVKFFDENNILKKSITIDDKKLITKDYNSQGVLLYETTTTDRRKNGPSKSFYPNGRIREEKHYINGDKNGKCKYYFENGQLGSISNYKKGELIGEISVYDKNGKVVEEKNKVYYDSGKLKEVGSYNNKEKKDGEWRHFTETGYLEVIEMYKDGELNGELKIYSRQGRLSRVIKFKNGKEIYYKKYFKNGTTLRMHRENNFYREYAMDMRPYLDLNIDLHIDTFLSKEIIDGNYKSFYSNHQLQETVKFKNGKKNGKITFYHENGQLGGIGNYKNGAKEGEFKGYFNNGKLNYVKNYKNDKQHGFYKYIYEKGNSESGYYKNGEQHGEWEYYNNDGQLIKTEEYKEGVLIAK